MMLCRIPSIAFPFVVTTIPSIAPVVHDAGVPAHPLDLDNAHPARSERLQGRVPAEVWDVDSRLPSGLDDRLALSGLDLPSVYCKRYLVHYCSL